MQNDLKTYFLTNIKQLRKFYKMKHLEKVFIDFLLTIDIIHKLTKKQPWFSNMVKELTTTEVELAKSILNETAFFLSAYLKELKVDKNEVNLRHRSDVQSRIVELKESYDALIGILNEPIKKSNQKPNLFDNGLNRFAMPNTQVVFAGSITDMDPAMLEFLPPELREAFERKLRLEHGGDYYDKNEDTEINEPKCKVKFDYNMVNTNQDLKELTEKLKNSKHTDYGILLYGESGTGKSMWAEFLAQELGLGVIKKRASDLIDKWLGGTEKNIKLAFKEAREKKAILILDEADSFLFDRKYAQRDFECASTNELLTQMEKHPYPFVMTTNLKEKLDRASLRRFLFKVKYDYMTESNIKAGIKTYFGKKYKLEADQLKELKYICAGDFYIAKRKMDVLEDSIYTNEKIYAYLKAEQDEKEIKLSTPINL